jgi:DNA-binding MarR family transcriptional regulator
LLVPVFLFACHTRHVRDPETGAALSAHQASILDHLDEVDAMTMTDLAGHMGVPMATMSIAIDRLEEKGYVRCARDPRDRRRVLLRVTPSGVKLREATSVLRSRARRATARRALPGRPHGGAARARAAREGVRALDETGQVVRWVAQVRWVRWIWQ